jgi:hypothetical protein
MKNSFYIFIIIVISITFFLGAKQGPDKFGPVLDKAIDSGKESKFTVYVYLKDKGPDVQKYLANPLSMVSQRSLDRRAKVLPSNELVDFTDVPVYLEYAKLIESKSLKLRHILNWFNCVSVTATIPQLNEIASLNCVKEIELVERFKSVAENPEIKPPFIKQEVLSNDYPTVDSLNYGPSATQNTQIKVNLVHNQGIYGQGVIVANFDAGYQNLNHEVFSTLPTKIWRKKDFQTGDTVTLASHSHGQATFSLVGGYKPGQLIGPAFMSTFVLCRTEVDPTETPVEMDNWSAAAQWADSLGVDVITSSLGYLTFDAPYSSYSWQDMNGKKLLITRAAALASHKGIVVSNSAGNDGSSTHNTLGGPADADSIITVGAVTNTGVRASYSSVGPTTDSINNVPAPRIKPDIMTMGSGNQVATQTGYSTFGSGTSWACPMNAGVVALMLSANKNLTPLQVRGIIRKFASNNSAPNNLIGWGIVDAQQSVDSARKMDNVPPTIIHTQPFTSTLNTGTLTFKSRIFDNGIIRYTRTGEAPRIYYRKNTGSSWTAYTSANFTAVNLDTFSFQIPGSALNTQVEYYIAAQDIALPNALSSTVPAGGSGINPPGMTNPPVSFAFIVGNPSGISGNGEIPYEFRLYNNYPNPFNPSTLIKYELAKNSFVSLKVYDISGKLVSELVNSNQNAGYYEVRFEAGMLSSGVYFYTIEAGKFKDQKKMLFIK